ncbi:MAG: LapA family protein [Gammaproteobacteria bacterium]|nr:LapA family protein [Gammaproteobacteria bacterium]
MHILRRIIAVIFVVSVTAVGVIFALANRDPVMLYFLDFVSLELPIFFWLFTAFVLGVLVGLICLLPRFLITRGQLAKSRKAQHSAVVSERHESPDSETYID